MKKRKKENFEIEKNFYEKLIKINPDFLEVLFQLSRIYISQKRYKKVLEIDKKIVKLLPFDPISYYNLACDYSILEHTENSLKNLKIALLLGFKNNKYIKKDPDLKNLRDSAKFKKLVKKIIK